MTLTKTEFVRRFAQHIVPLRFVRIRHYGIVSSSWKRGKLQALQARLHVKRKVQPINTLLRKCPCCKTGTLITIEVFGKRGPPKQYLVEKQKAPVNPRIFIRNSFYSFLRLINGGSIPPAFPQSFVIQLRRFMFKDILRILSLPLFVM